jgi:K+-transporting ATPase c subunit
MEISEKVLGKEYPSTLTSMTNLAFIWKSQGRAIEAIS